MKPPSSHLKAACRWRMVLSVVICWLGCTLGVHGQAPPQLTFAVDLADSTDGVNATLGYQTLTEPLTLDPATTIDERMPATRQELLGDSITLYSFANAALTKISEPQGTLLDRTGVTQVVAENRRNLDPYLAVRSNKKNDCKSNEACEAVRRKILQCVSERQHQVLLQRALQAHYIVHATTLLAIEQVAAYKQLDTFTEKQLVARESGFAIKDPLAIDRLRVRLDDSTVQIISAHQASRSVLATITASTIFCDYQPALELTCDRPDEPLCDAIQSAQARRSDLRALQIFYCSLSNETDCDWTELLPLVSNIASPLPGINRSHKSGLLAYFHRDEIDFKREVLRRAVDDAIDQLRTRIAAEVTAAWYKRDEAAQRLAIAKQLTDLAVRRQSQLAIFNAEVTVSLNEIVDADVALRTAKGEEINRLRDCQLADVDLMFSTGRL